MAPCPSPNHLAHQTSAKCPKDWCVYCQKTMAKAQCICRLHRHRTTTSAWTNGKTHSKWRQHQHYGMCFSQQHFAKHFCSVKKKCWYLVYQLLSFSKTLSGRGTFKNVQSNTLRLLTFVILWSRKATVQMIMYYSFEILNNADPVIFYLFIYLYCYILINFCLLLYVCKNCYQIIRYKNWVITWVGRYCVQRNSAF